MGQLDAQLRSVGDVHGAHGHRAVVAFAPNSGVHDSGVLIGRDAVAALRPVEAFSSGIQVAVAVLEVGHGAPRRLAHDVLHVLGRGDLGGALLELHRGNKCGDLLLDTLDAVASTFLDEVVLINLASQRSTSREYHRQVRTHLSLLMRE